jgi:preprotein translocase subunit SecE
MLQKLTSFLKEVYIELKKVSWLSRKEVFRYTLIVLLVSVFVAAVLGGLDYLFSTLIKKFIIR